MGLIVQHALSVRVQSRSTDTDWIVEIQLNSIGKQLSISCDILLVLLILD